MTTPKPDDLVEGAATYFEAMQIATARITALEQERDRLREAVRSAYREGYREGHNDRHLGFTPKVLTRWNSSAARNALNPQGGRNAG